MTLLQLDPDTTLQFSKTPNTASPSRTLKLTNLTTNHVAFKVKTTAPKAYLVRPSAGTLRPREHQEVQIILQPQGAECQANSHRFLVQATAVSSAEQVSREQWAEFPKDLIQEQRLNVVLEELQAEPAVVSKPNEAGGPVGRVAAEPASAHATAGGAAGGAGSEQPTDLKVKYDELVQYTLLLEKEKKKLEADMANLQAVKGPSSGDFAGYSKLHIIMVAVLAFFLSYA
eukprot:CAMPEP_0179121028 /NCGR_PEP_ID=MMETSP0796-20121207/57055_1 /TAXON_ID=73915 /ORGANISM="Pyrodinium bahamense, Strain pbaha01" /LENGTH=228 /DNA_ID=CAMNT_0020819599 /DNA_START=18 /DNA_END=700 /DNA_ORIENTATION=+